jgi:hypothetical protein
LYGFIRLMIGLTLRENSEKPGRISENQPVSAET